MDVALTVAGALIVALGLRDMFHTLLHPVGRGRLTRKVLAIVWRLSRATGHRAGSAAGATGMIVVITLWIALQVVGWALIYLPRIPKGFSYSQGIDANDYTPIGEALYFSFVMLTTLGLGDMTPVDPFVRAVSPIEALTGFGLLTTALAWFSQVYPPMSRRRALALQIDGLAEAGYAAAVPEVDAGSLSRTLDSLALEIARVRVDFAQHAEGFYFQEQNQELSLARQLPYVLVLRDAALRRPELAVRLSTHQLGTAIDQLGAALRGEFLRAGEDVAEVFAAYAADHRHDPRG
ncbi:potassium channel family protein [Agrococcus beijingensis]|uniref:potassium channel family protein n=1 Tax=Agrococcus beijingensis TaxID=3068634 RepID=UPI00274111D2|nr:potassium channel family protein [Agrococcus sp. REN33]